MAGDDVNKDRVEQLENSLKQFRETIQNSLQQITQTTHENDERRNPRGPRLSRGRRNDQPQRQCIQPHGEDSDVEDEFEDGWNGGIHWMSELDTFFKFYEIPMGSPVDLVAYKLKGVLILGGKICNSFVNDKANYLSLVGREWSKSYVKVYTAEFHRLSSRKDLSETESEQVTRGAIVLTRWIEKIESVQDMSGCNIDQKVKYTTCSFVGKALTWWNSDIRKLSRKVVFMWMTNVNYYVLWNHVMVGAGHAAYTDRFYELARLVPHLMTLENRKIERYMHGLAPQIRGMVVAMEPKTMQKAVQIFGVLIDEAIRNGSIKKVEKKRKCGGEEKIRVLGPSVPPATPIMHPEGLVVHASTVTARVILGSDIWYQEPQGNKLSVVKCNQVNVQFLQQLQPEWSRSNATTRHKGKEIAKPITPPSESASEEDNDPEQAQKDKELLGIRGIDCCMGLESQKGYRLHVSHGEMLIVVKSYMEKIQEVSNADSRQQYSEPLERQAVRNTNVIKPGVIHRTNVSRSQLRSTQMIDKVVPNNIQVKDKKIEVEDHHRISSISNKKMMLYEKTSKAWKWWIEQQCPSGYKWVPKTKMKWVPKVRNENVKNKIVQLILFIVDSGCTKHMTGNQTLLCNFVKKYLGTVCFGNDPFALILGYGDLVQRNIMINMVYYIEGLNHNLFSVGQFYDVDLEIAFRKSTCFVRDLQGNNLLTGNRGSDLYTISLQEMTSSTPICLMDKASPTQA
ncbi:hypothetical protein Tco_0294326 [Tanacetum coccineum]